MMEYYSDDSVTLHLGDALEVASHLDDGSVDCIVTSPPYLGLRDYGVPPCDWPAVSYAPMPGLPQVDVPIMRCALGLEPSAQAFVGHLMLIFLELRRVLADDGTLWLNLGDSYATRPRGNDNGWDKSRLSNPGRVQKMQSAAMRGRDFDRAPKNMMGMPWRVAFALQDAGWILRNDVIWSKPNAMPESVTDRLSSRHEHLFMLTKGPRYYFDLDAIREGYDGDRDLSRRSRSGATNKENSVPRAWPPVGGAKQEGITSTRSGNVPNRGVGRNPGDVWSISTHPFPGAHFATMTPALAERCVRAGCRPGGVVLDPFSGSGTTGLAAARHGRRYVGIDLNREYLDLSLRTRLSAATFDFGTGA